MYFLTQFWILRITVWWYITIHLSHTQKCQHFQWCRQLSTATRWCYKRRFGCVKLQLKDWNDLYVFIVFCLLSMHAACNLICVWLDPYDACVKLNNQALFAFQYNLLPAYMSLHKNKAAWSGIVFVWWAAATTFIASKRTGYTERGEKTVKLGWNGGREQCRRAAARFYGLGSCSQPPTTRSLFLPAMYCSLHLSHYEPHLLKETRQNNETIGRLL